jgi:transposase
MLLSGLDMIRGAIMINCHDILFTQSLSDSRIKSAKKVFGERVVMRIIAFALFLLGAKRSTIADLIKLPLETFKSFIKNLFSTGVSGFEDRRSQATPIIAITEQNIEFSIQYDNSMINFPLKEKTKITIPQTNELQFKTIILTFLANGIIKPSAAAKLFNISTSNIFRISKKFKEEDITALIDKRTGQSSDYIFTPDVKAELIQQYTLACIAGEKISGKTLANQLKERCNLDLSDRSIRHHIKKLGLDKIKLSLPQLLQDLKKT